MMLLLRLVALMTPSIVATVLCALLFVEPSLREQTLETLPAGIQKSSFLWLNALTFAWAWPGGHLTKVYLPRPDETPSFWTRVYLSLGLQWNIGLTLGISYLVGASVYVLAGAFLPHVVPSLYPATALTTWPETILGFGSAYLTTLAIGHANRSPMTAQPFYTAKEGSINSYYDMAKLVAGVKARDPAAAAAAWGILVDYPLGFRIGSPEPVLDHHLAIGGLTLDETLLPPHYAFVGTTGSGKSISMEGLMRSALLDADGHLRARAFVYDPKSEMLEVLLKMGVSPKDIVYCQPYDARGFAWDIAADVVDRKTADQFAALIVPPSERQDFWANAPRMAVAQVIQNFSEVAPQNWFLNDLVEAFTSPTRLREALCTTPRGADLAAQLFGSQAHETVAGLIMTLRTYFKPFEYVGALWRRLPRKSYFSLSRWVQERQVLVLGTDPTAKQSTVPTNQALFYRISQLLLSAEEERRAPTWVFLDEAQWAGKLDGLGELLSAGRSYGVHVVLGFQDLNGLQSVYGDKEALSLVNMCANKAFLRLDSVETRNWASQFFGQYDTVKRSWGENSGTSTSHGGPSASTGANRGWVEDRKNLVEPEEFKKWPPPTKKTGVPCICNVAGIGAWRGPIPGEIVDQARFAPGAADITEPRSMPRPPEDQAHFPWEDADYKRLKMRRLGSEEPPRGGSRMPKGGAS